MAGKNPLEQVLNSWRVNNAVNLLLIRAISAQGMRAVPLNSRGRTVARQFAHMHNGRISWLRYNRAPVGRAGKFRGGENLTAKQLISAFTTSGKEIEELLKDRIATGKRIRLFDGQPVLWMSYLISHESHHRGQIALALKQNGMKLSHKVAIDGIWYTWYRGKI